MNDAVTELSRYTPLIHVAIEKEIRRARGTYHKAGTLTADVLERFLKLSKQGKAIRSGLFLFLLRAFELDITASLPVAAALEILHTAMLIHDDIMDHDEIRRGSKSIHSQYTTIVNSTSNRPDESAGTSLAICAGDIGYFLALQSISSAQLPESVQTQVLKKIIDEIIAVGFAQMDDVYFGSTDREPTHAQIMNIYRYKTARYTFSLPLALAAIIAQKDEPLINKLEVLGEHMGILFQLRDDEIGIFFSQNSTGKSMGTDIRENKKTYVRHALHHVATRKQHTRLKKLFGASSLTEKDMEYIQRLITTLHVDTRMQRLKKSFTQKIHALIEDLPIHMDDKSVFTEITRYISERTR